MGSAMRIAIANVTNVGLGDVEITHVSNYYEMRRRLIPGDHLGVKVNYTVSIVVGELVDDDGVGAADAAITSITNTIVAASTPANVGDASPFMGALVSAFEQVIDDDTFVDTMVTIMRSATIEVPIVNTVAINVEATSSAPTAVPTGEPTGQPTGEPTGAPAGQPTAAPTSEPTEAVRTVVDIPIQQSFGGLDEGDLNTDTAKSAMRIAIANVTNVGLGDVEITHVSNYYE